MWTVIIDLVEPWLISLDDDTYDQVSAALEVLADLGPGLGRPLVDAVSGSRHRNMKELRPGSSGKSEIRVLFAFDPARKAVLLIAGDKRGDWKGWYRTNVPIADNLYDEHLQELKTEGNKNGEDT